MEINLENITMQIYRYADERSCMLLATNTFLLSHSFSFYIFFRFNIIHFSFYQYRTFFSFSFLSSLPFRRCVILRTLVNSQNDVYRLDFVNSISFLSIPISRARFIAPDKVHGVFVA